MKLSAGLAIILLIVGPCVGCTNGNVRLTNNSNGVLQICKSNEWKMVCSKDWGNLDAAVACRQLGYDGGYTQSTNAQLSITVDSILYHCNGQENSLKNCGYNETNSRCYYGANITCVRRNASDPCSRGDIRLWGGETEYEGNIEICTDHGVWSAVCDVGSWRSANAVVACRQLGYTDTIAVPYSRSTFGQRIQPMEFGGLDCRGNESSLQECTVRRTFVEVWSWLNICNQGDYSGVRCIPTSRSTATCTNGQVRLMNGYSHNNGFAEICIDGIWIRVCFGTFRDIPPTRICNQLGYPRYAWINKNFFPANRSEPQAYVYFYESGCRADSSTSLDCVRNESLYGVPYLSSCRYHGILCCPNDTAMCCFQPRSSTDPTTPPPVTQPTPSIEEDKAEFVLDFGVAATSIIISSLVDLRGLEEDIQKRIMDDILDQCDCPFDTSALKGGFFSFGVSVTYHSKVLGVAGQSAVRLVTMLKGSIMKDPLIQYRSANTYLATTFYSPLV